jgi:hypothetical protein
MSHSRCDASDCYRGIDCEDCVNAREAYRTEFDAVRDDILAYAKTRVAQCKNVTAGDLWRVFASLSVADYQ